MLLVMFSSVLTPHSQLVVYRAGPHCLTQRGAKGDGTDPSGRQRNPLVARGAHRCRPFTGAVARA